MSVGIYGGTFDPVHNGHVIMALAVMEKAHLDKLIIMPTRIPPHKQKNVSADFERRFRWSKIAFEGIDGIETSDFEGKKEISYTIDTVSYFEKTYGKISYIMGEDSFVNIEKWYMYEDLLKMIDLYVYPRYCRKDLIDSVLKRIKNISDKIYFLDDLPVVQISSTSIRNRAHLGLSLRGYVPDKLEKDIFDFYRR